MTNTLLGLWGMARPMIMLSVILVYALGALVARAMDFGFDLFTFNYGLLTILLISLSIHYVNEYADYETDALTTATPYSGGSGAIPSGLVPRALALQAGWTTLILGLTLSLIGIIFRWLPLINLPILLIGAFGGWMYSMPPLKLAWRGWGEADNAFLGGMLLPIYGFVVQSGHITEEATHAFFPFMLFVFLNLLATTWADRTADAQVGKFTLATKHSIPRLKLLYITVASTAFIFFGLCAVNTILEQLAVNCLIIVPFVIWGAIRYTRTDQPHASVHTMVALLIVQMGTWYTLGG